MAATGRSLAPDPGPNGPGLAWPGLAWPGPAWPGLACPGLHRESPRLAPGRFWVVSGCKNAKNHQNVL
jgi:hypothetical protein